MPDSDLEKRLRAFHDVTPAPDLEERLLKDAPASRARRPAARSKAIRWDAFLPRPFRAPAAALIAVGAIVLAVVSLRPAGVGDGLGEILDPVAHASGLARAVHVVLNVHTSDREDFDFVDLDAGITRVEGWVRWPSGRDDRGRMRFDSGSRVYTFDGAVTTHYVKATNEAWRSNGGSPKLELLWPAAWLEGILQPQDGAAEVLAREETGSQGRLRLHWNAPDLRGRGPAFFGDFEREVEVTWDLATKRLTGYTRWVVTGGERRLFSEVASIEYLDKVDEALFSQMLPADVRWVQILPAPAEFDALAPREAARRFWSAAIAGDWETVRIFCPSPATIDWLRDARPTEMIRLDEPFQSGEYPGVYIPYEVRFQGPGGPVRKGNLAMRRDNERSRWVCDGGI